MRERELKVMIPTGQVLPEVGDAVPGAELGPEELRAVHDTYHDTADLRLARWGATLRWREGTGWTVKLPHPADGAVLDRDEIVVDGTPGEPPAEARGLVAPLTRSAPLVAVAELRTERSARAWRRPGDGALVAELVDDRVTAHTLEGVAGGPHRVTFREVEVELGDAAGDDGTDPADLLAGLAERLGLDAAVPAVPKVLRVLGPAAGPPDVVVPELASAPTAAEVVQLAIASSVAKLLVNLPQARLGEHPEGVHQARVATRRLRSDLRTFRPLLDQDRAARLRDELGTLGRDLGHIRDADVLADTLRDALAAHPGIDPASTPGLFGVLDRQRVGHRSHLLARLDDPATTDLLDRLVAAAAPAGGLVTAGDGPATEVLPPLVAKAWRQLHRAVRRLDDEPRPEELHEVRILAKRMRYASEAVAPALGRPARRSARHAATIQDILGRANDAQVAAAWLAATARTLRGPGAFAAGRLAQQLLVDAAAPAGDWHLPYRDLRRLQRKA